MGDFDFVFWQCHTVCRMLVLSVLQLPNSLKNGDNSIYIYIYSIYYTIVCIYIYIFIYIYIYTYILGAVRVKLTNISRAFVTVSGTQESV